MSWSINYRSSSLAIFHKMNCSTFLLWSCAIFHILLQKLKAPTCAAIKFGVTQFNAVRRTTWAVMEFYRNMSNRYLRKYASNNVKSPAYCLCQTQCGVSAFVQIHFAEVLHKGPAYWTVRGLSKCIQRKPNADKGATTRRECVCMSVSFYCQKSKQQASWFESSQDHVL